jgi:hypothetical protein
MCSSVPAACAWPYQAWQVMLDMSLDIWTTKTIAVYNAYRFVKPPIHQHPWPSGG